MNDPQVLELVFREKPAPFRVRATVTFRLV
jgi:hypothetical protein